MHCFTMTALTHNGDWCTFNISDIPCYINDKEFVLLNKPNSPILLAGTIRRGDSKYNLFEGDIVSVDNHLYLVCYERGFYLIDADYQVRYFSSLLHYTVVGTSDTLEFPVKLSFRLKHLFKTKGVLFRLQDIIGSYKGDLLIRTCSKPVPIDTISQECCFVHDKTRMFFGDIIDGVPIEMYKGRLVLNNNNIMYDATNGGIIC